jgi:hypothetical protein
MAGLKEAYTQFAKGKESENGGNKAKMGLQKYGSLSAGWIEKLEKLEPVLMEMLAAVTDTIKTMKSELDGSRQ